MKINFSLSLTVLLLSCLTALAQKAAPVGLELYSFRDQFAKDVPGTMAKVKQMGFREVEVAGTYGMSTGDFRKLLDQHGLKAIGVGASFEDLEGNVPKVLTEAKTLGAKYVVCFWIPHAGDAFTVGTPTGLSTCSIQRAHCWLKMAFHFAIIHMVTSFRPTMTVRFLTT
jgi:hypothetical protein